MISKLEKGARRVDAVELTELARVLDCPVSHLLSPVPEVISRRAAVAESDDVGGSETERGAYRTETQLSEWLRDVGQLTAAGVLHPKQTLRYPWQVTGVVEARGAARWLRVELDLAEEPIDSVAEVCERAGQLTTVVPLASDGASVVDGEIAVAVVNVKQAPGRRRSTAAHELAHMVLGDEFSSDVGVHAARDQREQVMEAFAAELLLPAEITRRVAEIRGEEAVRQELVRVSATYRVSWSLAVSQLRLSEMLDADSAHRLRVRTPTDVEFKDALGWKPQPDLASVRVPPGFAAAVVVALREDLITPTRAVEMMRGQVSVEELTEEAAG